MKKLLRVIWIYMTRPQIRFSEINGAVLIQVLKRNEQRLKRELNQ